MILDLIDTRLNAAVLNGKHEAHAALKELKEAILASSGNAEAAAKAWAGVQDADAWLASVRGTADGKEVQK